MPRSSGRAFSQTDHVGTSSLQIKKPELAVAQGETHLYCMWLEVVASAYLPVLPTMGIWVVSCSGLLGIGLPCLWCPRVPVPVGGCTPGSRALCPVSPSRRSAQLLRNPLRWWPPSGDLSLLFKVHCRHSGWWLPAASVLCFSFFTAVRPETNSQVLYTFPALS